MKRLVVVAVVAGCSIADSPYPLAWDPLSSAPLDDCRRFAGTYADRGEAPGHNPPPSLTRELFGPNSPWEKAIRVQFERPAQDAFEVTIVAAGMEPVVRRFSAQAGEFQCDRGKLVLRNQRWVASDLMSGKESVQIDLHEAAPFLVAHVHESMTGVMFLVVPLAGESARWFRFPRLNP